MKSFEKSIYILILLISIAGMLAAIIDPHFFETVYAREDGVIESATALALLFGSVLSLYRVIKLRNFRSKLFLAVTLICGLVFFFGAGEEISWGQRIFHWQTPQTLLEMNAQGETNFHNLTVDGVKLNKLIFSQLLGFGLFCYLLVIPFFYERKKRIRVLCDRWAVPVPTAKQIALYFVFSIFITAIPQQRKWEVLECAGSMMFWMILSYPKNKWIYDREVTRPHSHKPPEP